MYGSSPRVADDDLAIAENGKSPERSLRAFG
jgi:hypothetical protein